MLKQNVLKIVGQVAREKDTQLTRLQKFEVFCNVCDGLLKEGKISSGKHQQWTEVF
jgi:hypothetical protein